MEESQATRTDLILTRRAVRSDWPIPAEARGQIVSEMLRIVSSSANDRERIGAARVLIVADSVNVRREAFDLQAELKIPKKPDERQRRVAILRLPDNGRDPVPAENEGGIFLPENGKESPGTPIFCKLSNGECTPVNRGAGSASGT